MSEPLAMDDFRNLPRLMIETIRARTWFSPNSALLRQIARVANGMIHSGLDADSAIALLASQARADMPAPFGSWTPEMLAIADLISGFLASPIGRCDAIERERGFATSPAHALELIRAHDADERAKLAMPFGEADDIIRAAMAAAAIRHPELGLSFGYIGNVGFGPSRDDRSWMIFTKLSDRAHANCCSIHFGGHPTDRLGELAFAVRAGFAEWADRTAARLAAGELHRVGSRLAA